MRLLTDIRLRNNTVKDKNNYLLSHIMFYLYMCSMIVVKGLGFYDNTNIYRAVLLLGCLFIGIKILLDEHSAIELAVIISLLLVGVMSWRIAGNQGALMTVVMIISIKGMDIRRVFKTASFLWLFTFIIQIITQLLWLRPRDYVIHSKFGLGYIIRWALGYAHPNVLQIMFAVIVITLFLAFVPTGKSFIKWTLCSTLMAIYVFIYSASVTGALFFAAFIVLAYYLRFRQDSEIIVRSNAYNIGDYRRVNTLSKIEEYLIYSFLPIAIVVSVGGPILFKGKMFEIADSFFNTRFSLSRYFLTEYGPSLFGRDFSDLFHTYTLDCSFVNLLMNGGIVIFVIIIVLYMITIIDLVRAYIDRTDDLAWIKLACILSVCFAGMSEPFLFNNSFKNISLFIVGDSLYKYLSRPKQIIWHGRELFLSAACTISDSVLNRIADTYRIHKKMIITLAVLAGLVGAIITASAVSMPERVYARRWNCNAEDHESLYLTSEEIEVLREDDDVWVLDYKDASDPMQMFEGSIIRIEYYRDIISSFIITGWVSLAIAILALSITSNKSKESKQ